jgi:hypothetical protein
MHSGNAFPQGGLKQMLKKEKKDELVMPNTVHTHTNINYHALICACHHVGLSDTYV